MLPDVHPKELVASGQTCQRLPISGPGREPSLFIDPDGLVDPWTQSGPRVTVSPHPVDANWLPDTVVFCLSGLWLVTTTMLVILAGMCFSEP